MLWNLTLDQLLRYYEYGYKYDLERRGYRFKEKSESFDELREHYYTPEERREQEQYLEQQYGVKE